MRSCCRGRPTRSPRSLAWCYEHDVADRRRAAAARASPAARSRRRRGRARARAARPRPLVRPAALADRTSRPGVHDGRRAQPRARERAAVPARPGRAEQSQIGGNIATNAGGPHAFKYGVTGELGDRPRGGRAARRARSRSAARSARTSPATTCRALLIGSEGTLGIVTAAWLKLMPAPEAALPVAAFYAGTRDGLRGARARGRQRPRGGRARVPRRGDARAAAGASFPGGVPDGAGVPASSPRPTGRGRGGARARRSSSRSLGEGALGVHAPATAPRSRRSGAGATASRFAVQARRGGKVERGHRRPARPARGGDRGDARDRPPPRPDGLLLGPRRRRQPALDVPGRPGRRGRARRADAGGRGALRPRRRASAARSPASTASASSKRGQLARQWGPRALDAARGDQAALRPEEPAEPGQEARPPAPRRPRASSRRAPERLVTQCYLHLRRGAGTDT